MVPAGECITFVTRSASLDDLLLAQRICRKRGGEGRAWCRAIGDWYGHRLSGTVGRLGDEPAAFLLGNVRGKYFHIRYWSVSQSLAGVDTSYTMFLALKESLPLPIRMIGMMVDERDQGSIHMLARLGFKAMNIRRDWYAKGHDGIFFQYPIGRFDG